MSLPAMTRSARRARREAEAEAEARRVRIIEEEKARAAARAAIERGDEVEEYEPRAGLRVQLRAAVWRGRFILAPLVVLGLLHATGAALALGGPSVAAVAALGAVGAGLVWLVRVRRWRRREARDYAVCCLVLTVGWLAWTAGAGIQLTDFWLWAVGIVAALPWWQHRWPRPAKPLPEPEVVVGVPELWAANVAATGRALPGALLSEPTATEHTEEWRIEYVPGLQTHEHGIAALPLVSSGLRIPMERLIIEPHPVDPDPTAGMLKVLRRSPGAETRWLRQLQFSEGRVRLGGYTDLVGAASWRVYTDNSMWGGFIAGQQGIGKTRATEVICATLRYANTQLGIPTTVLYLDGQSGASSPTLFEHSTWAGGVEDAEDFLAGFERGLLVRQRWNRLFGLPGFTPGYCPPGAEYGLPGVLVVVDECHRIFTKKNAKRWAWLVREIRKAGMAVIALDQATDLSVFGDDDSLRTALLGGNGVAMRIPSNTAGGLIPGLPLDPKKLPELPGYGVKIAAPQSGERTAPFRMDHAPDAKDAARGRVPAGVPLIHEWFETTEEAPLDAMTADAFGDVFLRREERAAERHERDLAIVRGEVSIADVLEQERAAGAVDAKTADTTAERILDMVRKSPTPVARKTMIAELQVSVSAVRQALTKLYDERRIVRLGDGLYTEPGRENAA